MRDKGLLKEAEITMKTTREARNMSMTMMLITSELWILLEMMIP